MRWKPDKHNTRDREREVTRRDSEAAENERKAQSSGGGGGSSGWRWWLRLSSPSVLFICFVYG
jgi:hypothetical protein